jgi:hypothetical protein
MSYLKTAYAHGQADALAALGIKQANFLQKARTLFGAAEHAAPRAVPHGVPHVGAPHPVSGVHPTTPQDLIPQGVKDLGAQNRTIAGEAVDLGQAFGDRLPARPRPAPAVPGAAVKRDPTLTFDESFLQTVPAFHDLGQQFSRIAPATSPTAASPRLFRLSDVMAGG